MIQTTAIVFIIVEAIKRLNAVENRYLPLLALVIGSVVGYFFGDGIIEGIIAGAGAAGIYDVGKKTVLGK